MNVIQARTSDKAIYGNTDDRYNISELEKLDMLPKRLQTINEHARSVACMVEKTALKCLQNESFHLEDQSTLMDQVGLKADQRFAKEPAPGYGTAFLITSKLMVTAAHCVCKDKSNDIDTDALENSYIVFDFRTREDGTCNLDFPEETVYKIKRVVSHFYSKGSTWSDWAVIELNSEVKGRTPLPLDFTSKITIGQSLYMIGHPAGLPEKYTENALIKRVSHPSYFETDLDAFSGNSGSPVFDASSHKVVGILISGNDDFNDDGTYHHVTQEEIEKKYELCQRIAACESIRKVLENDGS